ncbi:polysaccharide biosynthesis tyrosine autokinase [Kriegella sp. EG-1]|nr:polysaccharide biosynthesis tyrosine autokinase [Flavobacteriaceae bacterium EG-1]
MFELNQMSNTPVKAVNIKKIMARYLKYWYLFAIGIFLSLLAAFLYVRYKAVPQYRISSTVLVRDKDKGSTFNGDESLGDLGLLKPSGNIEDQIGILSSSSLMEKVLLELDLIAQYKVDGKIKDIEVYGKNIFFNVKLTEGSQAPGYPEPISIIVQDSTHYLLKDFDRNEGLRTATHQFGDTITTHGGSYQVVRNWADTADKFNQKPVYVSFVDLEQAAVDYSSGMSIEPANDTGSLLAISLLDAIPARGKDIVRTLIEIYADESVKYQNQMAIGTIEIIDERLKTLTGEISDVERDIATYKRQNDLTNVSSDAAVYLQSAQQSNRELEEYQVQIDILNSLDSYLNRTGTNELVPSSLNIQDPTLSGLISQFNQKQLEKKTLLRTTPSDNPLVVNLDRSLSDIRANILENLRNVKNGLVIAQNNVRKNIGRSRAQIAKVPTAESALLSINRDQGIKQELYLYLLQKREEEALSLEAPISNTRIIDTPKASRFPVSPNKMAIYLGSFILGLFVPFAFVFTKNLLVNKIQDREDIEALTKAPILGEIAHSKDEQTLVVSKNNTEAVAELFRLMRFNLKYLTAGRPDKVILITSGNKGEGKTFFTINLAASLALSGKKVIALGFDLRAPKLLNKLNLQSQTGITDFIIDKNNSIKDILVEVPEIRDFHVIGAGPIPPNTGELMLHERIGTLIEELKKTYDYILIDSAPVGKVSDAFALASYVDASIYIVRKNVSGNKELDVLNNIFEEQKLKLPMVVLNDTEAANNYGYK